MAMQFIIFLFFIIFLVYHFLCIYLIFGHAKRFTETVAMKKVPPSRTQFGDLDFRGRSGNLCRCTSRRVEGWMARRSFVFLNQALMLGGTGHSRGLDRAGLRTQRV